MSDCVKTNVEGLAAAWSSGDAEKIASFFTEDCIFEDVCNPALYRGQEALKTLAREVFSAIPDLKLHVTSFFSQGNRVGVEWVETGMRAGKRFTLRGASMAELRGDKFSRETMYCHFDGATWLDS
jgi:ketosteroid isomerase-like protein